MPIVNEYLMSINSFNEPTVLEDNRAVSQILTRLILMDTGTLQTHPRLGVGLIKNYRYMDEIQIKARLSANIREQIDTYASFLGVTTIEVDVREKQIIISISTPTSKYVFGANMETEEFVYLNELKQI